MQTSRLFCWTVTNNIFSTTSSIDAAVRFISSPTWSPSSSWIAGHAISPKIGWLNQKRHTFESHIYTRSKLVTLEWHLELLLQGNLYILFLSFVHCVIYLRDEIIEFHEDRHNRNCFWSVKDEEFENPERSHHFRQVAHWRTSVPIPITGETRPEWNNLNTSSVAADKRRISKTHHIAWIWSFTSFTFAFSWRKESTSWNSWSPLLPLNQESRGKWFVGFSRRRTRDARYGLLAMAPGSTT